jgi:serine/threonine protein kinase
MSVNKKTLINQLHQTPLFDSRFSNIKVLNCDPLTGIHLPNAGVLSVVFVALDTHTKRNVILKFLDPDIHHDVYRYKCFEREYNLLAQLTDNQRCPSLVEVMKQLPIQIGQGGQSLQINCRYFVIDFVDESLDKYFYGNQSNFCTKEKLIVFKNIVLSVLALNNRNIAHRDLKPDNLRAQGVSVNSEIIAIDLGTGVGYEDDNLLPPSQYSQQNPVGAKAYAPIETIVGLSFIKGLRRYNDFYALGCILYELFNSNHHYPALIADSGYNNCVNNSEHLIASYFQKNGFGNQEQIQQEWSRIIRREKHKVNLPVINGVSSTVEKSVGFQLNILFQSLTSIDYRDRLINANRILLQIDIMLKILDNDMRFRNQRLTKINYKKNI